MMQKPAAAATKLSMFVRKWANQVIVKGAEAIGIPYLEGMAYL